MYLGGIGTATPARRYTKAQCWEAFAQSDWFARLDRRAHLVAHAVLTGDNGIDARHLAVDALDEVFRIDPDTLHARFVAHAPALGAQAVERALAEARLRPADIDAIAVSTCTGYLCPALSSYVAERAGLRADVQAFDLVGQGCAAALPNWQLCGALLGSGRHRHVLSVCVEVCSAAMYLDDDAGVMVSACLFGDGAGAAVLSAQPPAHRRRVRWLDSASLMDPSEREALRFQSRDGLLRNVLTRAVPQLAAGRAAQVLETVLGRAGLRRDDIRAWIMHAGGRDVLLALQQRLGASGEDLRFSARMLREYGNLSSAFVYFVLQAALADEAPGGAWWMSSFGAGFACHGALLQAE